MGLGDARGEKSSRRHIAPPPDAQEGQPSSRECHQKKEGWWQPENYLVGYFGKMDPQRRFKLDPLVRGHQKGTEADGGRRAASSRVPADSNVREGEGRGPTDTRSTRKADGSGVTMFRRVQPYQQSTKVIVQYQRAVPPGTTTLPIDRD